MEGEQRCAAEGQLCLLCLSGALLTPPSLPRLAQVSVSRALKQRVMSCVCSQPDLGLEGVGAPGRPVVKMKHRS